MLKKHGPGGCCCCEPTPDCTLLDDDFSTDTISDYNQASGSWSITGGYLTTGSANAVILWNTALPDAHSLTGVHVLISGKTNTWKYIVGWADSSNYLYVRARNGNISIWEMVGGVETQLTTETTITPSAPGGIDPNGYAWRITVCWLPSQSLIAWKATDIDTQLAGSSATTSGSAFGNYAGFGTGTLNSATVTFAEIQIYEASENCNHCFCNVCDVGTTPESITVEFDGVASDDCANCGTFNTTAFVLDREANTCVFYHLRLWDTIDCGDGMASPAESFYQDIRAEISCDDPATNVGAKLTIEVRYQDHSTGSYVLKEARFQIGLGCCKLDCLAALGDNGYYDTGLDVPFIGVFRSETIPSTDPACDWSASIARVTAVS